MPQTITITRPYIDEIINAVVNVSGYTWEEIISKSQKSEIVRSRNLFYLFVSETYLEYSNQDIANITGATRFSVFSGIKSIERDLETKFDKAVDWYSKIEKILNGKD